MSTGWNLRHFRKSIRAIINLLGNEYWLELSALQLSRDLDYKPTGK